MTDDWRKAYSQFGCQWVEPIEYLPCPGSIKCETAVRYSGDDEEDEGPTYPREVNFP